MGGAVSKICSVKNAVPEEPYRKTISDDKNSTTNRPKVEENVPEPHSAKPLEYEYNMDHKSRGMAIIFNHERFDQPGVQTRYGTNIDRDNLRETFKSLGFAVKVFNDRTYSEIKDELEFISEMNHSNSDCLVVVILSHGDLVPFIDPKTGKDFSTILSHDQLSYVHARDRMYPLQTLFSYFTNEKCKTLRGKPRLFFVQACQGTKLDKGFTLLAKRKRTQVDIISFKPLEMKPVLPQPDFLVAYSTLPGFFSFRNSTNGSWFMQSLCDELKENASTYHLLHLLTFVTQRVAYDFESNSNDPDFDEKKQIACVVSMLPKLLFFKPKRDEQNSQTD